MRRILFAALCCCASVPALAQEPAATDSTRASEPDSIRVYELVEVDTLPQPINLDALRLALQQGYPSSLLESGITGSVHLSFVVGADGTVRQPQILSSSDSAFDAPSLAAVAVLRFSPARVGGSPVATRVELPIRWQAPPPAAASTPVVTSSDRLPDGQRVYTMSEVTVRAYELHEVEEPPRLLNASAFMRELERRYPAQLRSSRRQGLVEVRFRINTQGEVIDPIFISYSTDPAFNEATIAAVRLLRFRPAQLNGRAVMAWVEQPITWSVNN